MYLYIYYIQSAAAAAAVFMCCYTAVVCCSNCCCSTSCAGWQKLLLVRLKLILSSVFFVLIQTQFIFNVCTRRQYCRIYGLDLPVSSEKSGMRGAKAGVMPPRRSPNTFLIGRVVLIYSTCCAAVELDYACLPRYTLVPSPIASLVYSHVSSNCVPSSATNNYFATNIPRQRLPNYSHFVWSSDCQGGDVPGIR